MTSMLTPTTTPIRVTISPLLLAKTQLRLSWRQMKDSTGRLIGTLLIAFFMLQGAVFLGAIPLIMSFFSVDAAAVAAILTGAALMAMLIAGPLILPGGENQLDLNRFSHFPLSPRQLMLPVAAAFFTQPTAWITVVPHLSLGVGITITLIREDAYALLPLVWLGVIGASFLTCAATMLWQAFGAARSAGRRSKERSAIVATAVFGLFGVAVYFVMFVGPTLFADTDLLGAATSAAWVLAWTPFGAPYAAAFSAGAGQWGEAIIQVLMAPVLGAIAVVAWRRCVALALQSPPARSQGATVKSSGLFLPGLPQNAHGAMVSQGLRYWVRDSRMLANLTTPLFLTPMMIMLALYVEASTALALLAVVVTTRSLASVFANDLGFLGPNTWVYFTSPISARALMRARMLVMTMLLIAMTVVISLIIVLFVMRAPEQLPLVLLGGIGDVFGVIGMMSLLTVYNPYRTSPPGTNPFKDRSSSSGEAFIAAFAALFGTIIGLLPGLVAVVYGLFFTDNMLVQLGMGVIMLINGIGLYYLGQVLSARALTNRIPEVFAKVRDYA